MHLLKVKALPVAILLCAGIWLAASGCTPKGSPPAVPTEVQVIDIPADDGTNVVIAWRRFSASTARQYDIYYSTDPESLTNEKFRKKLEPVTRSVQVATPVVGDTTANKVEGLGYYLVLEEVEGKTPIAKVIKATPENRDSLESVGEKIIACEHELAPNDVDNRELRFARGKFFRITPPEGEPEPERTTIENSTIETGPEGFVIEQGKGPLILDVGLSDKELQFRLAGDRIEDFDPENSALFFKYGKEIISLVTEKNRYNLSSEIVQTVIRGNIEPGSEYYYLIVAKDDKDRTSETEMMQFTPVDDPPMCPANTAAVLDTIDGRLMITWTGYDPGLAPFRDVDCYEIHRFEETDTALIGGELLGTFNPDFSASFIEGDFNREDMFYIASFDNTGQRSVSQPFGITPTRLSKPDMVDNLALVDVENDDGKALAVRWGNPKITLELNIIDPSPEYTETELPEGYYLIDSGEEKRLVHYEQGDTTLPERAVPVFSAHRWIAPETFDVSVRYKIFANDEHDVPYAKLRLDGGDWENDYQEVGLFTFDNLPAGEHTFEAVILNSAGREVENPEARVTQTVVIDKPGTIKDDAPTEMVQVWRGNYALIDTVEEKDSVVTEVFLEGPPHFEPTNKRTFELAGLRGILARQLQNSWPDSLRNKGEYYYFVRVFASDGAYTESDILGPMRPQSQWFHTEKTMVLILVILFVFFVNFFLAAARKGKRFYLRPIAGIAHLDEALGRATEMGRPLLYVLGLNGISDIATLAGLTILGRVAKKAAEFQTRLIVPCVDPIVLIVAQETVKTAFMDAGRPDAFNEDDIFYAAGSQFSYAAAVAGLMVRYKTAANFYMGMFYAESLILTETGSMSGSIQIAGTDAITQIPFFITTCDYTLIGEELYAASAYLSQDPLQVGSLKAQDMLKAIYMAVIVLGTVAMTSGFMWFVNLFKIRLEQ